MGSDNEGEDDNIEQLVTQLGIEIEDSFLSIFKHDADVAASLSLYLLAYIFCRASMVSRVALLQIIARICRGSSHVLEDFDDLKSWVDDIRLGIPIDDKGDINCEAE